MSSEQTFSTSDLRSTAQDYKRDAAHKHKWHLGAAEPRGREVGHPRPFKASETDYNARRRYTKSAVASLAHGTKVARKHDMLEGATEIPVHDDSSASSSSDYDDEAAPSLPPPDLGIMYSFDAPRGPTEGSQILNVALAKAVKKFEEKETVKLVKNEYDVIDSEGESVGLTAVKTKGKGRAKDVPVLVTAVDEDEDYEFV